MPPDGSEQLVHLERGMDQAQELRDRSQRFAAAIITFCDALPKDIRTQKLAGQLQDAATSMAMNYRAACRARSHAEFVAKICITVEEADEAQGWLETLIRSGKAVGEPVDGLLGEATELLHIFAASKRTAMNRKRQRDGQSPNHPIRESPNQ